MSRAIFFLIVVASLWWWFHRPTDISATTGKPAVAGGGGVVVIEFSDPYDLLAQLRRVPAGSKIDVRQSAAPPKLVSSGIKCSDKEAIAAYEAKLNQATAQLNQALEAEFRRIHNTR